MSGFYLMSRDWQDNPIFGSEPYSRRDAWVWLIEQAAYAERSVGIAGKTVTLQRGQLSSSLRYMAKAWKWDEAKVRRFLSRARSEKMIDAATDAGQTVITICNYDRYQAPDKLTDAPADAGTTQQRRGTDAKYKEGNKGKEEIGDKPLSNAGAKPANPFLICPDGVDPKHWRDFQAVRKTKKCTNTETAYEAVMRDLEKYSTSEWPPGRLVQRSAEKNWAKIVDPTDEGFRHERNHHPANPANDRSSVSSALDAARNRLGYSG